MSKGTRIGSLVALGIVGFVLYNSVYTVNEVEQMIITQFGKPVGEPVTSAGLKVKIPFIQEINPIDKRILEWDGSPSDMPTKDKLYISVDLFARWRIVDPLKFLRTVGNEVGAQARLDDIIYSELRQELGRKDLLAIVATDRESLMAEVTQESDKKARQYGIEIVDVRLKRADLPDENLIAIFGRMKAERNRIARQYRSQGKEEAQKIRATTDKERDILLADAYEKEQNLKGFGDAKSIETTAKAFGQDTEFYSFLKSLEVYRASLKEKTTLLMPADSEFLRFLKSSQAAPAQGMKKSN